MSYYINRSYYVTSCYKPVREFDAGYLRLRLSVVSEFKGTGFPV